MTQDQLDAAIDAAFRLGHPLRYRILRACVLGPESPATLTPPGELVGGVAYHFRVLRDKGLLEVTERRRRHGGMQTLYVATDAGRAALEGTAL